MRNATIVLVGVALVLAAIRRLQNADRLIPEYRRFHVPMSRPFYLAMHWLALAGGVVVACVGIVRIVIGAA